MREQAAQPATAAPRRSAVIEDVDLRTPRGLDCGLFQKPATCGRIRDGQHSLIGGPTGVGKSFLGIGAPKSELKAFAAALAAPAGWRTVREGVEVKLSRNPKTGERALRCPRPIGAAKNEPSTTSSAGASKRRLRVWPLEERLDPATANGRILKQNQRAAVILEELARIQSHDASACVASLSLAPTGACPAVFHLIGTVLALR